MPTYIYRTLTMSAVTKEIHLIGGIQVGVFKGPGSITHSVAILFLLHGRKGSVKDLDSIARTILEKNTENDQQQRKLLVVTLVKLLPILNHVIGVDFVATFRIIVTMDRDLLIQRLIVHGPATAFMRMSTP